MRTSILPARIMVKILKIIVKADKIMAKIENIIAKNRKMLLPEMDNSQKIKVNSQSG